MGSQSDLSGEHPVPVHNVPMAEVAKADGTTATMGQSPFAIARGQAFERSLYRRGWARCHLPVGSVSRLHVWESYAFATRY